MRNEEIRENAIKQLLNTKMNDTKKIAELLKIIKEN